MVTPRTSDISVIQIASCVHYHQSVKIRSYLSQEWIFLGLILRNQELNFLDLLENEHFC